MARDGRGPEVIQEIHEAFLRAGAVEHGWVLRGLGGGMAGLVGPRATRWLSQRRMHLVLGSLIFVLGVWTVVRSWG